ncbi:MAG: hypothetical protein M1840_005100 [Geoglossum simile]|nr:MAG: hypothetical protein M1840_005100 [Geoglossum simile]
MTRDAKNVLGKPLYVHKEVVAARPATPYNQCDGVGRLPKKHAEGKASNTQVIRSAKPHSYLRPGTGASAMVALEDNGNDRERTGQTASA